MSYISGLRIETSRLILRPYREGDAGALWAALTRDRDHVRAGWAGALPESAAEVTGYIAACTEEAEAMISFSFAVLAAGQIVGGAVLARDGEVADLGYWIASDRTGRGYATEVAGALAHFALSSGIARRVRICSAADNAASIAVAGRLGCRFAAAEDDVLVGELDQADLRASSMGTMEVAAADGSGRALLGTPSAGPVADFQALRAALEAHFGGSVPVTVAPVTAAGQAAVVFTAPVAPERSYAPQEMLRHNATLAVGAICLIDAQYVLRHVAPLGALSADSLVQAVVLLDHEARRLGRGLGRRSGDASYFTAFAD